MTATVIIPVFIGWLAGLTINYLADALPETRKLTRPLCRTCKDGFIIGDYILLRRCRNGHGRGVRTWIIQLIGILACAYIWLEPPPKLGFVTGMALTIYFAVVFIIDLEHRLILHPTSVVGALIGLVVGTLSHGLSPTLIGGVSGLAIMLAFYFMGVLFARYRTRRMLAAGKEPDEEEALGAGDVILVTILGLMLGWPLIWFSLLFGILLGGAVSLLIVLWLVISRRYRENALMMFIPYGPYFITSAYLIIFFPGLLSKILPS